MTPRQLAPLCVDPASWVDPLSAAMERFDIVTAPRATMFLATCAHESARFARLEENLNYSAAGLLAQWDKRFTPEEAARYARKPEAIANRAYANRGGNGDEASGDGWLYRGRGPIGVTFRDNYRDCGTAIGQPLEDSPALMVLPGSGAFGAAWAWWRSGCNAVADEDDFPGTQGLINRGSRNKAALNMDDRWQWLQQARRAWT